MSIQGRSVRSMVVAKAEGGSVGEGWGGRKIHLGLRRREGKIKSSCVEKYP